MTAAISLTGVGRRYGDHDALAGFTAEVASPSIVGLLGRNGAGKSTLLRIMAGQEFATSGRVSIFGAGPRSATPYCAAWFSSARTRSTPTCRSVT